MPCEAWSLVLKVFAGWLEQALVLVELVVLSQAAAARDIESEEPLHDGAGSRRTHQAGNRWHPMVGWPT